MADKNAWVTLATNDAYSLGALVLAHSLQHVGTKYPIVVLVTPSVTNVMRDRLTSVFSEVITVDVLDSKDAAHLALLARPELGITFTKLHCWNLTQYTKCVFLDADTLVFHNCDELFDYEELSAAPDVGWPDCFNSGVFVYQPSKDTFEALIKFAQEKGSFDGGDQGLLNQFFSGWARGDIKKHLPFLYNVCSTAFYSYLPALKQFGNNTKIMHFIGSVKPWLQKFNWASRTVCDDSYLQAPLQHWWNIFLENVHSKLDASMVRQCGASNEARYFTPHNDHSPFPWHHTPPPEILQPSSVAPHTSDFYDPWEYYTPAPQEAPTPPSSRCSVYSDCQNNEMSDCQDIEMNENTQNHESIYVYQQKPWYENYTLENNTSEQQENINFIITERSENNVFHEEYQRNESLIHHGPGGSHCGTVSYDFHFEHNNQNSENNFNCQHQLHCEPDLHLNEYHNDVEDIVDSTLENDQEKPYIEEVRPRHPYDNYYLQHTTVLDRYGCKRCSHEELPPAPSPSPTPSMDTEPDLQAGIAGALSQMSPGTSEQSPLVEEHLRRQGWEAGHIDYMGADAFTKIWEKISQTLSSPPQQPSPSSETVQQTTSETVRAEPEKIVQEVKKLEISTSESKPPTQESTQTSTDVKTETQEPQATTEGKQDSAQATIKAAEKSMSSHEPPRPIEKLVCQLKPKEGTEPILTPENEHEDAASIASSIIASEKALSSPTVTSPTSPLSSLPVCPALPQNVRDLCIDTKIPETPPVPGPVSLAQIGIIPSTQDTKLDSDQEQICILKSKDSPVSTEKQTENISKTKTASQESDVAIGPARPFTGSKQTENISKTQIASQESDVAIGPARPFTGSKQTENISKTQIASQESDVAIGPARPFTGSKQTENISKTQIASQESDIAIGPARPFTGSKQTESISKTQIAAKESDVAIGPARPFTGSKQTENISKTKIAAKESDAAIGPARPFTGSKKTIKSTDKPSDSCDIKKMTETKTVVSEDVPKSIETSMKIEQESCPVIQEQSKKTTKTPQSPKEEKIKETTQQKSKPSIETVKAQSIEKREEPKTPTDETPKESSAKKKSSKKTQPPSPVKTELPSLEPESKPKDDSTKSTEKPKESLVPAKDEVTKHSEGQPESPALKKEPPKETSSEAAAKPKRVVKKAVSKTKSEEGDDVKVKSESEVKKTEESPVPPPRKKEKKPKEK